MRITRDTSVYLVRNPNSRPRKKSRPKARRGVTAEEITPRTRVRAVPHGTKRVSNRRATAGASPWNGPCRLVTIAMTSTDSSEVESERIPSVSFLCSWLLNLFWYKAFWFFSCSHILFICGKSLFDLFCFLHVVNPQPLPLICYTIYLHNIFLVWKVKESDFIVNI